MEGFEIESYVIDASVAVKWFVNEKDSEVARKIKDSYVAGKAEIIAPNLIYYEVLNALRFHPVARFSPDELRSILSSLKSLQFTTEPSDDIWFRCLNFSLREGTSIYDSIYLALASSQGKFITADSKLLEKLSDGVKDNVIVLNKLKSSL